MLPDNSKSLGFLFPRLAAEWHPNNAISAFQVRPYSEKCVMWQCDRGHCFEMPVWYRVRGTNCPYCSGRKACVENCLATSHPEVLSAWHPTLNGTTTPYDVTPRSAQPIWCICTSGHSYKTSPRRFSKTGCPYCSGRLATPRNCLAIKHPEIAKEWDTTNNHVSPHEVTPCSGKKVGWICPH